MQKWTSAYLSLYCLFLWSVMFSGCCFFIELLVFLITTWSSLNSREISPLCMIRIANIIFPICLLIVLSFFCHVKLFHVDKYINLLFYIFWIFYIHCGLAGKESACNVGDLGSTPGLGRSPEEGKGYPLQYSGLQNSMDCVVHGVKKSQTWLSDFHFLMYFCFLIEVWSTMLC